MILVLVRVTVPPLVLVGPAEVMDNMSPFGSWETARSLALVMTSGWFWVAPALVLGAVGGVLTTCTTMLVTPRKLLFPAYSALTEQAENRAARAGECPGAATGKVHLVHVAIDVKHRARPRSDGECRGTVAGYGASPIRGGVPVVVCAAAGPSVTAEGMAGNKQAQQPAERGQPGELRVVSFQRWFAVNLRGASGHCSRRADILSALDATQPLSGSYQHWTPKADRMSARRSFGRDGGGRARMRPSVPRTVVNPTARRRERLGRGSEATLTGLGVLTMVEPRVARGSQPGAEGCTPFGIVQNVRTSRTCSRRRKSALISVTAQECADCRRRLQCRSEERR